MSLATEASVDELQESYRSMCCFAKWTCRRSALILNFPAPTTGGIPEDAKRVAAGHGEFKTCQCILCAFVYDEAAGLSKTVSPLERAAQTGGEFGCTDCLAKKADFESIEF